MTMETITLTLEIPTEYVVTSRGSHVKVNLAKIAREFPATFLELACHGTTQKVADSVATLRPQEGETAEGATVRQMSAARDGLEAGQWKRKRAARAGEPDYMRHLRALVRDNLADALRKEYKDLDAEKRNDWLDEVFESFDDEKAANYVAAAEEALADEVAEKAKKAKRLAALGGKINVEL